LPPVPPKGGHRSGWHFKPPSGVWGRKEAGSKKKLILHKTSNMTLNNSKSIINLKIRARTAIILFLTYLILAYAAKIIKFPLLGISSAIWTIFFSAVFLFIIFSPVILQYHYIFYSDEGNEIIFRYFSSGVVEGKKNSVEINKKTFTGFTLEKKFFGLVQSIVLYQRLKEGVAKYPPVSISALKRKEREKLLSSLNSYAPRIKGKNQ
jgi:hypothetical protein